jgi:hypothetical protein
MHFTRTLAIASLAILPALALPGEIPPYLLPPPRKVTCGEASISTADRDGAIAAFKAKCDGTSVDGGDSHKELSGMAFGYLCSYGGSNPCRNKEYDEVVSAIEQECNGKTGKLFSCICTS